MRNLRLPRTAQPRTRTELAKMAGIQRQHFDLLLAGRRRAQDWIVARIAKGWGLSESTVRRALSVTRTEAELTS